MQTILRVCLAGGKQQTAVQQLGKAVKRYCRTNASFDLLDLLSVDTEGLKADTWTSGGCWILADAIQRGFGGEIYAVCGYGDTSPQHIVVRIEDRYLDADGASTRATLLRRWRWELHCHRPRLEPRPKLRPVSADELANTRIPPPRDPSLILAGIRTFLST